VTRYARDLRHGCTSNRKTGNGGATYVVEREASDPGFGNSFTPRGSKPVLRPWAARLTLTTNGSQLAKYAAELAAHGVKRINVSVDTLDDTKFRQITRWGELSKVKDGIRAAQAAGLQIKINAVALKGVNDTEIPEMIRWTHGEGMDLTLIETMPLGDIDGDRTDQYLPLSVVRAQLMDQFTLEDIPYKTGGPARYVRIRETGAASASSRRSPITSAKAATACASPAPARSTCA
jgi:molybdenum cofactor biosynthesis enzyme MoaA